MVNNLAITLRNFITKFWKLTELLMVKFLVPKNHNFLRCVRKKGILINGNLITVIILVRGLQIQTKIYHNGVVFIANNHVIHFYSKRMRKNSPCPEAWTIGSWFI